MSKPQWQGLCSGGVCPPREGVTPLARGSHFQPGGVRPSLQLGVPAVRGSPRPGEGLRVCPPHRFWGGSSLPPGGTPECLSPSPPVSPALRAAPSARSRRKTVRSGRSPRRRCPGSAAESQRETAAGCGQAPGPAPRRPAPPAPYPRRPAPGRPCCGSRPPRSARTGCAAPPPPSPRSAPPPRRHPGEGHTPRPPGRAPPSWEEEGADGHVREVTLIAPPPSHAGPDRPAAAARPSRLQGCDPRGEEQKGGRDGLEAVTGAATASRHLWKGSAHTRSTTLWGAAPAPCGRASASGAGSGTSGG